MSAAQVWAWVVGSLDKIPATFWGVVIGSLFTLAGIYFTDRSNNRRFQRQLAHDKTLKDREREMAFRKDIYLAAAETIQVALGAITRFGELGVPQGQLTASYIEKAPAFGKAYLVAKEKLVGILADFSTDLSATFLRLTVERLPLAALHEQIIEKQREAAEILKARSVLLELLKRQNIDGTMDPRKAHVINSNFSYEGERIAKVVAEQEKLERELKAKHLPFIKACALENLRLGRVLAAAILAAREELELSIDLDTYTKIFDAGRKKGEASLNEFFQTLIPQMDEPT